LRAVKHHQNISLYENHFALDLILSDTAGKNHCAGAYVLNSSGEILPFIAAHTAICSGGAGQVYKYTTNPDIATGDGIAIAYRAGAEIVDMEFIQFHPTTLVSREGENILLTEALRGAGAELVNRDNEPFLYRYHKLGSLAPRDIVARAMVAEMIATDHPCIYLDASRCDKESLKNHFTQAAETCSSAGYNLAGDRIPVVPAAHYTCGGIKTDLYGRTTIPSLYAFGEAACTGVHGGNRLASNSLLEALVFSHRAYVDMLEHGVRSRASIKLDPAFFYKNPAPDFERIHELRESVKELTWKYAGISRKHSGMKCGYTLLQELVREAAIIYHTSAKAPESAELYNMCLVAGLIFQQAMGRTESRGLHFIEASLVKA
jgi:L-aspartate oxidase